MFFKVFRVTDPRKKWPWRVEVNIWTLRYVIHVYIRIETYFGKRRNNTRFIYTSFRPEKSISSFYFMNFSKTFTGSAEFLPDSVRRSDIFRGHGNCMVKIRWSHGMALISYSYLYNSIYRELYREKTRATIFFYLYFMYVLGFMLSDITAITL